MTRLADAGSTLSGVSWLGVLLIVALLVVGVVLPIWRQTHDANRERRRQEAERYWHETGRCEEQG